MVIVILLSLVVAAAAIPSNYVLSAKDGQNLSVNRNPFKNNSEEIAEWPNITPIELILNMIKIAEQRKLNKEQSELNKAADQDFENSKNENSNENIPEQSISAQKNTDRLTDSYSTQATDSNEISNLTGNGEQISNDTVKPFVLLFIRIIDKEVSQDSKSVENKVDQKSNENIKEEKFKEPLEDSDKSDNWFRKLLKNNEIISSKEVSDPKGSEQQNDIEKNNVSNENNMENDKSTVNPVVEDKNSKETDSSTPGLQFNVGQKLDEQNKEIKPELQDKVPNSNIVENNDQISNNEKEQIQSPNTPVTNQALPLNPLITEYTTNKPFEMQNLPEGNVIVVPESDRYVNEPIEFVPEVINERPSLFNRPSFLSGLFSYLPSFPFRWPWKFPSHFRLRSESYPEYSYKK